MVGAGHRGIYEPGMDRVSPGVLGGVLDGSGLVEIRTTPLEAW